MHVFVSWEPYDPLIRRRIDHQFITKILIWLKNKTGVERYMEVWRWCTISWIWFSIAVAVVGAFSAKSYSWEAKKLDIFTTTWQIKKKLKGPKSNVILPFKAYKVKVRRVKLQQMLDGYIDARKTPNNNANYQRVHGVHLVYYFNLPGTEHLVKSYTLVVQKAFYQTV